MTTDTRRPADAPRGAPGNAPRDLPAIAFAMVFPAMMAWLYLVVGRSAEAATAEPSGFTRTAFAVGKIVQFGFPVLFVAYCERDRLHFAGPSRRGVGWGLGFGLLIGGTMLALYFGGLGRSELLAATPEKVHHLLQDMGVATPGGFLLLATFYCVVHALLEEYYWRWFVFGGLRRYTPLGVAIALSALGFAAHHLILLAVYFPGRFWTLAVPLAAGVAIGGAAWAWIYQRSGSLYAAWLSHGIIDAAIMVVGYAMLRPFWET